MTVSAPINGKEVFDLLRDDLAALELEFGRDAVSGVRAITEIGEYLRAGGGKRIRPALLLLSRSSLTTAAKERFGSAQWSRLFTPRRWYTTTSSTKRRRGAAGPRLTRNGEIPSAFWRATGFTCRLSRSRCRNAISAFSTP